jgi:hypothetical protein
MGAENIALTRYHTNNYTQFMIILNEYSGANSVDKVYLNCELSPPGLYHHYYKPQAIGKHSKPV